jgi:hypothetical protein
MKNRYRVSLLIVTSAVLSNPVSGQLDDGLVSYFQFETDFSNSPLASGPDGMLVNGATAAVAGGIVGNAMQLVVPVDPADPTANQHLLLPVAFGDGTTLGQTFTVSAWYNLNEIPTDNGTSRYFVFEGQTGFDISYGLRDSGLGEAGINDGQVFTDGGSRNVADAALPGWHHVLQVYSLDGASVGITTYVDGAEVSSLSTPSASFGDTGINFGAARDTAADRGFDGLIDEVAIWDRALTYEEAASVYSLGLNAKPVVLEGPAAAAPAVTSFSADPAEVIPGSDATISWNVTGAESLTLFPAIGNITPVDSGNQVVTVNRPSTYLLVAINGSTVETAEVTIETIVETFPADLSRELVAYYSFEVDFANDPSASGLDAVDGVAMNGATAGVAGGVAGNAMSLNTDSNQHLNAPVDYGSDTTLLGESFSVSAWYNLNDPAAVNDSSRYFVFESQDGFDVSFGLRDLGLGNAGLNDGQTFTQTTGGSQSQNYSDAGTGDWRHVVQTYSALGGTTTIITYIDGVAVGTPILAQTSDFNDNLGFNFGAPRSTVTNRGFDGLMDEIALWSRALSEEEVALAFQLGTSGSGLTGGLKGLIIINVVYDQDSGNATIEFNSISGATYSVDTSTDLIAWEERTDNLTATGEITSFTYNTADPRTFFRVRRQ